VVISYRRFGTTYLSYLNAEWDPNIDKELPPTAAQENPEERSFSTGQMGVQLYGNE
jgi:hypothetical protein